MSEFEFKVGDRVKCAFYGDEIFTLEDCGRHNALSLAGLKGVFYTNGRCNIEHTHSVLTLVERAKTKVKVTRWMNVYPNDFSDRAYGDDQTAERNAHPDRIACVELTGEYER